MHHQAVPGRVEEAGRVKTEWKYDWTWLWIGFAVLVVGAFLDGWSSWALYIASVLCVSYGALPKDKEDS